MFGRHFKHRRWRNDDREQHERHSGAESERREARDRGHRQRHGWRGGSPVEFMPRGRGEFGPPFPGGPFGGRGPFGPGGPFGEDGGGRRRHRRGDIKYALLELVAEQPRHGYELIKELEQRYGGFYRPSPGSVYPTLQLLEDEGLVVSETVEGKRVYTITDTGNQALEQRREQRDEHGRRGGFRERGPGPELEALRESAMALFAGVMQVARHGTPAQVEKAKAILEATRREIYALLARDEA